ncbi:hypothetical protein MUP01_08980 [Candidatus Bathyarchaeota archaeon]|nr:hypothetical protein [Candidatus Bathyarchaeota archaeon]
MSVFKCPKCGKTYQTTANIKRRRRICIACRRKQGLLNQQSKRLQKELERLQQGKELSRNHKKGMLLEYAVSKTLDELGIPHDHNPFDITRKGIEIKLETRHMKERDKGARLKAIVRSRIKSNNFQKL